MHACGEKISSDIDINGLLELAVICEDYQCAIAMLPWCRESIGGLVAREPWHQGWLYIAWVFAIEDIFQILAKDLVGLIAENHGRKVIIDGEIQELNEHIPQRAIDWIITQRSQAQERIISACQNFYDRYNNSVNWQCHASQDSSPITNLCTRLINAELYWGFGHIGMLESEVITIPTSMSRITRALRDIAENVRIARVAGLNHSACAAAIEDVGRVVQAALDSIGPLKSASSGRRKPTLCIEWWQILSKAFMEVP
ncbi:hypothetical protein BDD12DRAFT_907339 [Trichophaea hybrida]|nr:hypothetical protein BDD12DRAFT_907339 [Trichophaea hybrida]